MEKLSRYKETVIFASCAAALVGTVLVLQKATTPLSHRRHAGSSASRGVPRSRSASRGPTGARSRGSSRVRATQPHDKESAALTVPINPVTAAAAGDRSHANRNRDASQAHTHRHHGHVRNPSTAAAAAAETNDPATKVAEPVAAQVPKRPLTVEAVAQHTKALGTANALQNALRAVDVAGVAGSPRDTLATGGGGGEDGANCGNASNAATVGSQALYGASATSPAVDGAAQAIRANGDMNGEAMPGLSPRGGPAVLPQAVPTRGATHASPLPNAGATKAAGAPTQTNVRWFCHDRGTQTEPTGDGGSPATASITPDRWTHPALMSPILPHGECTDSAVINVEDFDWTPMREADSTKPMHTTALPLDERGVQGAVVPSYFLSKLESQIRILVRHISDDKESEKNWMRLYLYLSELPLTVRKALAERRRCGVTTDFTGLAMTMSPAMTYSPVSAVEDDDTGAQAAAQKYTEQVTGTTATAATPASCCLPKDVLHLLQHGTPQEATACARFTWKDHRCVCVGGAFVSDASSDLFGAAAVVDARRDLTARFAHLQLSPSSSSSSSVRGEEESNDAHDDEASPFPVVVAVAKHIEKYNVLLSAGTASHSPDGVEIGAAARQVDDQTPVRNAHDRASEEAALEPLLHEQQRQQHLASLVAAFLQLKQSAGFQALRQSPQFSPFACDFVELASAAQHFLDGSSLSPDGGSALLLLHAPATQKRLVLSEATDARDTSIGTTTSARSDSNPTYGAGGRSRRGVKVRTPMKPSIRYPIQHVLSNSPSSRNVS
ncbi:hypothetical protein ABB37_01222 [Leptomonas pyrrhocoris]|uniref:Uncharacterized protein n=1 Tax=Leptomonas pyrrhocoris TaxID=157538 RepID=A0A0N0VH56_LEPPY|nr:hypothetical protein ABB37_01222 [Leptomonas pyrrhocoris]KPA84721.1 hypothetical protein ABB37_01222 [Leptomonas pyrrhocoris]|eukprot:XP_015663160.1 hypothetical protein ABB37_01222 [Leptomonas pyrrhocoris]